MPLNARLIFALIAYAAGTLATAAEPRTMAEYFVRMQQAGPMKIIAYCGSESPETRDELSQTYTEFAARFDEAVKPLLVSLHEPVTPST